MIYQKYYNYSKKERRDLAGQVYLASLARPIPNQADGKTIRTASLQTQKAYLQMIESGATSRVSDFLQDAVDKNIDSIRVVSDTHVGHMNIIEYAERPFFNVQQMNATLMERMSELTNEQILLCLGDFGMGLPEVCIESFNSLSAQKVLIVGNHDLKPQSKVASYRAHKSALAVISVGGVDFWLTHYPIYQDLIPEGVINLHGHTHNNWVSGPYVCACVEHWDYTPQSLPSMLVEGQKHPKFKAK